MTAVLSGPMFEPSATVDMRSVSGRPGAHYNIFAIRTEHAEAVLRRFFPAGECDDMNLVVFSTGGVHGTYATLDEIHASIRKYGDDPPEVNEYGEFDDDMPVDWVYPEVTFTIYHPRLVCLRYGLCPVTMANIRFLKKLRASSRRAMRGVGW